MSRSPTSLAYDRESVSLDDERLVDGLTRCPRKLGWVLMNRATGQLIPARCGANTCPYCMRVNAYLIAGAIGLAGPERAVRLSLVGDDWQTVRKRVNRLIYRLRSAGYDVNMAHHVEPNPAGTGHHIHGWQYGDFVPQAQLQDLCRREGMGFPYIEQMKRRGDGHIGYGLKLAGVGYGMKMAEALESGARYLACNGGRLVHATRGFWRLDGQRLAGQREAMRTWARLGREDEREGTWVLLRER